MRVLLVGGGGREHALAWGLSKSASVSEIIAAPGNPGIGKIARCVPVRADDIAGLVDLAVREGVDLVVVGPEAPLVAGLPGALRERGIAVFGPGPLGARLEGSKAYAKGLMERRGIPTARANAFESFDEAVRFAESFEDGVVVKADGLAAGKGVTVCDDSAQATEAIREAIVERRFGEAGARVLVEERLIGEELSVLAFSDGKTVIAMEPAQDFKRAYDGDRGPNTGGMGSYSPVSIYTEAVRDEVIESVLEPIAAAMVDEGEPYVGVIYAGLMLTSHGVKVVEFNARFGDPETQSLIPRLRSDLAEVMLACTDGSLAGVALDWDPRACVSVVAASSGYPETDPIPVGFPISGLEEAGSLTQIPVFHASTRLEDGQLVTAGGRVFAVSALGPNQHEAAQLAYKALSHVYFEGIRFRSDIAAEKPVKLVSDGGSA